MDLTLKQILWSGVRTGRCPLIIGQPGCGKTMGIKYELRKMAKEICGPGEDIYIYVLMGGGLEPPDVTGFATVSGERWTFQGREYPMTQFAPRDWARTIAERQEKGLISVIFVDEFTSNPSSVQVPLMGVVNEGRVGDLQLDPNLVFRVAACNPVDQAADGHEIPPPMANRVTHYQFPTDLPSFGRRWSEEFPGYWGEPPVVGIGRARLDERIWRQARAMVAGFIHRWPDKLQVFPNTTARQAGAWPSARSFEAVSQYIARALQDGGKPVEADADIRGAIGDGEGREVIDWLRATELPDPEEVLAAPLHFKLPDRGDLIFAVIQGVTGAALDTTCFNKSRWNNLMLFFGRMGTDGYAENAMACVKRAAEFHFNHPNLDMPTSELRHYRHVLTAMGALKAKGERQRRQTA